MQKQDGLNNRHQDAKALRQLRDKLDRKKRQEVREALEKWAAAPPPPVNDLMPIYKSDER